MAFMDEALPGMKESGFVITLLSVVSTAVFFLGQAVYAVWRFWVLREKISKFYAALIVVNITAMALVTFPVIHTKVSWVSEEGGRTVYTATPAASVAVLLIHTAFGLHSVCNCCRVIFDISGKKAAQLFMPVAYVMQAWLLLPLGAGWITFGDALLILTAVDYMQHIGALVFWCWHVMKMQNRERERRCIYGVALHMTSVLPLVVRSIHGEFLPGWHGASILFCSVFMMGSQANWIAAAELTPCEEPSASHGDDKTDVTVGASIVPTDRLDSSLSHCASDTQGPNKFDVETGGEFAA